MRKQSKQKLIGRAASLKRELAAYKEAKRVLERAINRNKKGCLRLFIPDDIKDDAKCGACKDWQLCDSVVQARRLQAPFKT